MRRSPRTTPVVGALQAAIDHVSGESGDFAIGQRSYAAPTRRAVAPEHEALSQQL